MKSMNEDIKKLIELQYKVVPLAKNKKIPLISQWTTKASAVEETVQTWEDSFPGCNWGVATGRASGILVVDIDPRHGGDIQWKRLTMGKKINTVVCKTGGGGEHYYFEIPSGTVIGNAVLSAFPGIDIRGDGGQAVVPPSMHESGKAYEWVVAPWDKKPQTLPEWLIKIISNVNQDQPLGGVVETGQRNNSIFHQSLMLARQGALLDFIISTMKTWRETTGARDLTDTEIEATAESAYKRASLEKESRSSQQSLKTDTDNANRLVRLYNERLRYAPGYGWLVWNGKTWIPDDENARVINLATESMLMLRDEALEESKTPENFKAALAKANWAMNSLNAGRLHSAVSLGSTRESIRVTMQDLDPRDTRFLLNVRNGIIDLQTGELAPHDPKKMITKLADVDYNPEAKCPFWEHTFELAFDGNKRLIEYMKRAIGYSITGSVAEQCLFICWGEQGNNGKSTILETLQWLFSPYAQMSDMKVVTSPDMDNRVASSLAKLPGVRMVSMNEADENQKLSEALVKQLTGGDTLQACKKFHEPFEFSPIFKLWIRTNEKPIIRGMSDAIWRRIKLIPFVKSIPAEHRKSRDFVDDSLHAEAEGILTWCVQGAQKWLAGGLKDPEDVQMATAGYRSEMDIIQAFFDECVIEKEDKNITIPRIDLYQTFSRWAHENGVRYIMSSDAFGKRVTKKLDQNERVKVRGQYVWKGIALTDNAQNMSIS